MATAALVSFTTMRGVGSVYAPGPGSARVRENFALSIEPIDIRLTFGLTIGDPEVIGTFANGLFQIWHGIFSFHDAPSPGVLLP